MSKKMEEGVGGRMEAWMNQWVDEWVNACFICCLPISILPTFLRSRNLEAYCAACGTLLNVMWQPGWEGSLGENRYRCMYGWVPLLSPEATTTLSIVPIDNTKYNIIRTSKIQWCGKHRRDISIRKGRNQKEETGDGSQRSLNSIKVSLYIDSYGSALDL